MEVGNLPANLRSTEVMLYEMKEGLNAYLATLGPGARMKTLPDLIKFNEDNWAKEMPLFGQQRFSQAQAKGPLTDQAYLDALAACRRVTRQETIDGLMEKHSLDALVSIAAAPAGLISSAGAPDPVFGEKGPTGGGSGAAAIAGYPSVTVPAAQMRGLPVGILFFGRAWSDAKLLALAADFEAGARARVEPQFRPTIERVVPGLN